MMELSPKNGNMKKLKTGLITLDQFMEKGIPMGDLTSVTIHYPNQGGIKSFFNFNIQFRNNIETNGHTNKK